jgi:hypothetical protein
LAKNDYFLTFFVGSTGKSIEGHRMEIVWTFIGNRMDFGYP